MNIQLHRPRLRYEDQSDVVKKATKRILRIKPLCERNVEPQSAEATAAAVRYRVACSRPHRGYRIFPPYPNFRQDS